MCLEEIRLQLSLGYRTQSVREGCSKSDRNPKFRISVTFTSWQKRWRRQFAFAWFGRDPNYGRSLKPKNLEFFGEKPIWSRTEVFDERGLTVHGKKIPANKHTCKKHRYRRVRSRVRFPS